MRQFFLCLFFMVFFVHLSFESAHAQAVCDPDALTTRVSVASDGTQGNEFSGGVPHLSGDGRYVSFWSAADNLVPNDTNERADAFVYDRQTCTTHRISVSSAGVQSDDTSYTGPLSADGRYAVFESAGSNLVANDISCDFSSQVSECFDIFVHDLQTGQTVRVSIASDGTPANDGSYNPRISSDGRYIVFDSPTTNLVSDDTNHTNDVFVHDRDADNDGIFDEAGAIETIRVSVAQDGTEANAYSWGGTISGDGRYVAFMSRATNLVSGTYSPCFVGTTPSTCQEIFVRDMQDGSLTRVTIGLNDAPPNDDAGGALSNNGRYVVFDTYASNLVSGDTNNRADVFVHDLEMGQTQRISVGYDGSQTSADSHNPAVSGNGRYVAFQSEAENLVEGGISVAPQIFVRDLEMGQTVVVSRNADGIEGNNGSGFSNISLDGAMIAFVSNSSNLVSGDNGLYQDVFAVYREMSPPSQPPEAPTLLAPADNATLSDPRPEFTWDTVIGATGYEMQLDTTNPPATSVYNDSDTSYTPDSDLADGIYYWRVQAQQNAEVSTWSTIRTLTIDTPPATPTLIAPADGASTTDATPTFSWNAVTDAVSYEIQIGRENPPNTEIIDLSGTNYTPAADLLTTTYYWRVRSKAGDVSEWSAIFEVTIVSAPDASPIRNLFATGTPTLSWNRITGATAYRVQVARDSNFTDVVYENPSIPPGTLEVTPTLTDGVYYWRVRALKSNIVGAWSAAQSFIVDAP